MMERNYGIELLRIIAMFMIVVYHVLGQGGVIGSMAFHTPHYHVASFLYVVCSCAVNVYALISGFVLCDKKFHISRLFNLYLTVAFYTVLIFLVLIILGYDVVSPKNVLQALLPLSSHHYWYLSSYFGLLILMPFLNRALVIVEKRELILVASVGFVFFSVIPTLLRKDPFLTNAGISTIWLCILYLVGGYIRKYDVLSKIKSSFFLILFLIMVLITYLSKIIIVSTIESFFHRSASGDIFISYTSPMIIVMSIALFCFIASKSFAKSTIKIIKMLSPMTLSVYVIHENLLVRKYFVNGFASFFLDNSVYVFTLLVLGAAVFIYFSCSVIDYLRIGLFRLLGVRKILNFIDARIQKK